MSAGPASIDLARGSRELRNSSYLRQGCVPKAGTGFFMSEYSNRWMWSEAVEMLARAERLHRQLFEPVSRGAAAPVWEPPADLIETDKEVVAILALPGVDPKDIVAVIEGDNDLVGHRRERGVPPLAPPTP